MENLPQLPEPYWFKCERCAEPLDLWDWGSHPHTTADLPPAQCWGCLVDAAREIPKEQDGAWPPLRQWMFVDNAQYLHHEMRRSVGNPPGTVIAWQLDLADRNDPSIGWPTYVYTVRVDWWDQDWPQLVIPWRLSWESRLVVLGAHVLASGDTPASWRFLWRWHDPGHQETLVLDPPDALLTKDQALRLSKSRGAFHTFEEVRGRPPHFKNVFDFYKASYSAVAALSKRPVSITPESVGSYLIERSPLTIRPDSIGDRPADPGRQFRKWCDRFKLDPEGLLEELQSGL